jgi:hypothetical protein
MPSPNDEQAKAELDSAWKFFSVCEERQKFYVQTRNTMANFLLAIGGALLAFVFQDEKIGGWDYVVGGLTGWLGVLGFGAILAYRDAIFNWNERAIETLKAIDRLSSTEFTSKYIKEEGRGKASADVVQTAWNFITSREGLYGGSLLVVGFIGLGICAASFVFYFLE